MYLKFSLVHENMANTKQTKRAASSCCAFPIHLDEKSPECIPSLEKM